MHGYRQGLTDIPEIPETSPADSETVSPYTHHSAAPQGATKPASNQYDGGDSFHEATQDDLHHQEYRNVHLTPADTWSQRRLGMAYIRLVSGLSTY